MPTVTKYCQIAENLSGVPGLMWDNPERAQGAEDNLGALWDEQYASGELFCRDFDFGLPAGAVATNVKVEMRCKTDNPVLSYVDVLKWRAGGAAVGNDVSEANEDLLLTSWEWLAWNYTVGQWGLRDLTVDDWNAATTGVTIKVYNGAETVSHADALKVTLTYSDGLAGLRPHFEPRRIRRSAAHYDIFF